MFDLTIGRVAPPPPPATSSGTPSPSAVFPILDVVHPDHPYKPLRTDSESVALLCRRKRNGVGQEWDDTMGGLEEIADDLEYVPGGLCKVVFARKRAHEVLLVPVFGLRQCLEYADRVREAGDGPM